MLRRFANRIMLAAVAAGVLAACGQVAPTANPYGATGNSGYASTYGTTDYGSDYSSDYSSDSSYSSDYGSDYGSSTGSYGNDPYGTGSTSNPYASPSPKPSPTPDLSPSNDKPVLTAWVTELKNTGFLGLGKAVAKVEVHNPGDRTLSGKLTVRFTKSGDLTANNFSRRVTLAPKETQVLTFTAEKGWRLNDAEAMITTDEKPTTKSSVSDR